MTNGRVGRPYIGIRMLTLTPAVVQQLRARNLKVGDAAAAPQETVEKCCFVFLNAQARWDQVPSVSSGVLVADVMRQSPAEAAGLAPGDVLVAYVARTNIYNRFSLSFVALSLASHWHAASTAGGCTPHGT